MDLEKVLIAGVEKEIINDSQRNDLLKLINSSDAEEKPTSIIVKILYYIGGFMMIFAMTALMSETIENSSYTTVMLLGILYALLFLWSGEFLWKKNEKLPAGVLYFLFISTIAFIIVDIEKMTGFFPHFADIDKYSNYYEMCRLPIIVLSGLVLVVNTILQKYRNVSLLAIPSIISAYTIYILVMNFISGDKIWETKPFINSTLFYSIILTVIAFLKDRVTKADYSKWMYIFGAIGIFFPMILIFNNYFDGIEANMNVVQLQVLILSLIYGVLGTLIQRKVFTIIGIFGVVEFILYLESFIDNVLLLISCILITGLLILYLGVSYNRNLEKIIIFLENLLPAKIKSWLPRYRKI